MKLAFLPLLALAAAVPAHADQMLNARSPKASIDTFLNICRQSVPDAACRCLVRNMVQTAEGDFLIDAAASGHRMNNIQKSVGKERVRQLASRHDIGLGQALDLLDGAEDFIKNAGRNCG